MGRLADGPAGRVRLPGHRHAARFRVSRDARMAAQLGAAHRARHRRERRPAGHGGHARHARRSFARAGQSRLGRAVARVAHRHERPGRDGVRAVSLSGIILQLAARAARTASSSSIARTAFPRGCRNRPSRIAIPSRSSRIRRRPTRCARKSRRSARGTLPLCDLRHDARRTAVSDRRAARLRRPAAGNAALGHRLHGEPGLGAAVVLFRHPLAGGADRDARQQPRHRRARRQRAAGLGEREGGGAGLVRELPAAVPRPFGQHGRARIGILPSGPGRFARASRPTLRWSARRRAPTKRSSPPARRR